MLRKLLLKIICSKYIIFCTSEQIKKASKLGAPCLLTSEEMISWLEEQGPIDEIIVDRQLPGSPLWDIDIITENQESLEYEECYLPSRKEATLKAITIALDYLKENKK